MGLTNSVTSIDTMDYSYDPVLNGLLLKGKLVPEPVLEIILSCVNMRDILKLRRVCLLWRDVVSRRTFWKFVFEKNGAQWDSIPNHIKENERGWVAMYWLLTHKNLVKNHSGHDGFKNWDKDEDYANKVVIESPPVGISPLPPDPNYPGMVDSAFVTSFRWIMMQQKIIFSHELMDLIRPFDVVCTLMVGARFDCGGEYSISLDLVNSKGEPYTRNKVTGKILAGTGWTEISCPLTIAKKYPAKYLIITLRGKDNQFWAGHYGTKFSRISLAVKCRDRSSCPT